MNNKCSCYYKVSPAARSPRWTSFLFELALCMHGDFACFINYLLFCLSPAWSAQLPSFFMLSHAVYSAPSHTLIFMHVCHVLIVCWGLWLRFVHTSLLLASNSYFFIVQLWQLYKQWIVRSISENTHFSVQIRVARPSESFIRARIILFLQTLSLLFRSLSLIMVVSNGRILLREMDMRADQSWG